jgi:hypothetical protein
MIKITITLLFCLSLNAFSAPNAAQVIYGEDNRRDLFEVSNPLFRELAHSTAAMVSTEYLSHNGEDYSSRLSATLEQGLNICPGERFSQQPLLAGCSGFLIGKDTIVTAGHCYMGDLKKDCSENLWVFDYAMEDSKSANLDSIKKDNVYKCKSVVKQVLNATLDFAIIKLDRDVVGRKALKYRKSGKVSNNTELVVIGHPSLLPVKISDGGTILNNRSKTKFITTLDTFQGNSGSAVFDAKTGLLEGILVSGKTDYISSKPSDPDACEVVNECDMNGLDCFGTDDGTLKVPGEAVIRITELKKHL